MAPTLFDIKYVKLTEGDFGISLIKQSGESPMPTVCIYKENEKLYDVFDQILSEYPLRSVEP